jgi:hypothetical protein
MSCPCGKVLPRSRRRRRGAPWLRLLMRDIPPGGGRWQHCFAGSRHPLGPGLSRPRRTPRSSRQRRAQSRRARSARTRPRATRSWRTRRCDGRCTGSDVWPLPARRGCIRAGWSHSGHDAAMWAPKPHIRPGPRPSACHRRVVRMLHPISTPSARRDVVPHRAVHIGQPVTRQLTCVRAAPANMM